MTIQARGAGQARTALHIKAHQHCRAPQPAFRISGLTAALVYHQNVHETAQRGLPGTWPLYENLRPRFSDGSSRPAVSAPV